MRLFFIVMMGFILPFSAMAQTIEIGTEPNQSEGVLETDAIGPYVKFEQNAAVPVAFLHDSQCGTQVLRIQGDGNLCQAGYWNASAALPLNASVGIGVIMVRQDQAMNTCKFDQWYFSRGANLTGDAEVGLDGYAVELGLQHVFINYSMHSVNLCHLLGWDCDWQEDEVSRTNYFYESLRMSLFKTRDSVQDSRVSPSSFYAGLKGEFGIDWNHGAEITGNRDTGTASIWSITAGVYRRVTPAESGNPWLFSLGVSFRRLFAF